MNQISGRLGGICAVLFVILMAVGVTLGFDQPDNDAPDQEWIDYVGDDGKLVMNLIGGYLLIIAGVLFMVFLVGMYRRIRAAEANDTGFPLLMLATGTPIVAPPESAHQRTTILVAGGLSAAAMSAVLSYLILQTKVLPVWLAYFGFVAALAMVIAAAFIPVIVFALWMLVLGIVLATSGEQERRAATA